MNYAVSMGVDDFRKLRSNHSSYYVDKSLFIKDFLESNDEVTLITRPRRFGKTLNMTMTREFLDISKNSKNIFDNLAIMNTDYAKQINTKPVLYFSLKNCKGKTAEDLLYSISHEIQKEYLRCNLLFEGYVDQEDYSYRKFYLTFKALMNNEISIPMLRFAIGELMKAVAVFYQKNVILLIDEYDQPILSSYEHGYHKDINDFFSGFFGSCLKGNEYLERALLTGIQRVVKESIFSELNHVSVYTVLDSKYASYFGLTEAETEQLLHAFDMELTKEVKQWYDGYLFAGVEIYNPWSILSYVQRKKLKAYWVNTSTNFLVRTAIKNANDSFKEGYYELLEKGSKEVALKLETSFIELANEYTLWGLLVNSGYLTITCDETDLIKCVAIPNGEVRSEFLAIIAEESETNIIDLEMMFQYLLVQDMDNFLKVYQKLVTDFTSHHDAKENAYHMLFLGMCLSLQNLYKISSNLEAGHGRYDIRMESLSAERFHILIEFKKGSNTARLKKEALKQILDKQYYAGLTGNILCIGIAHTIKKCEMEYQMIENR